MWKSISFSHFLTSKQGQLLRTQGRSRWPRISASGQSRARPQRRSSRDSFWAGVRVLAGMTRKCPLNRLIRSIRVIRVQTLSLAALHTEGAEDGSEDGDDEIDYFLNHNAKIQHFSFPTHRCSSFLTDTHRLSLIGLCSISMILSHRNHDTQLS